MSDPFHEQFAPITSSIGLIKAPLHEARDSFVRWQNEVLSKYGQEMRVTHLECGLSQAISKLLPFASPIRTRYLFLELGEAWTAFVDNGKRGTDAEPIAAVLASKIPTTTLRLTVRPNTIRSEDAKGPGTYGAVIFQLFEKSQVSRRSISCANDGGTWVFQERGEPYPFENLANYQKRNVAERFTPMILQDYAREIVGFDPFSESSYVNQSNKVHGELAEKVGNLPAKLTYFDLAEARRALGIG